MPPCNGTACSPTKRPARLTISFADEIMRRRPVLLLSSIATAARCVNLVAQIDGKTLAQERADGFAKREILFRIAQVHGMSLMRRASMAPRYAGRRARPPPTSGGPVRVRVLYSSFKGK